LTRRETFPTRVVPHPIDTCARFVGDFSSSGGREWICAEAGNTIFLVCLKEGTSVAISFLQRFALGGELEVVFD